MITYLRQFLLVIWVCATEIFVELDLNLKSDKALNYIGVRPGGRQAGA